jgi:uncharacterized protein
VTADPAARLADLLGRNPVVAAVLARGPSLGLPGLYLGAGCVVQSVWNALHGYDPAYGIDDYDLVYFDASDLSAEAEASAGRAARELLADLGPVTLDVTNEARVHLWYEQEFGVPLAPYTSSEDAIASWPMTASSIGVRTEGGRLVVCAPFGLDDLFAMVVRPNKRQVPRAVYEAKCARWQQTWPRTTVTTWDAGPGRQPEGECA